MQTVHPTRRPETHPTCQPNPRRADEALVRDIVASGAPGRGLVTMGDEAAYFAPPVEVPTTDHLFNLILLGFSAKSLAARMSPDAFTPRVKPRQERR